MAYCPPTHDFDLRPVCVCIHRMSSHSNSPHLKSVGILSTFAISGWGFVLHSLQHMILIHSRYAYCPPAHDLDTQSVYELSSSTRSWFTVGIPTVLQHTILIYSRSTNCPPAHDLDLQSVYQLSSSTHSWFTVGIPTVLQHTILIYSRYTNCPPVHDLDLQSVYQLSSCTRSWFTVVIPTVLQHTCSLIVIDAMKYIRHRQYIAHILGILKSSPSSKRSKG